MLFCFSPLSFSQKKRERLDGENIYIRHSNLMLEVCMTWSLFQLVACNLLHSLLMPLSSFCAAFGFACENSRVKCFCMLVNMKICNHLTWLFVVSIYHTYLKNIWLGLPLPLVVPLFYPLLENSTLLLKKFHWIFQKSKLLYIPNIKFFIFWTECGKVRETITIENGLKILGIPENDRTVKGRE